MQIEGLAFSVEGLRRDADEIEASGGGNEAAQMRWAANEIERLQSLVGKIDDIEQNAFSLYDCDQGLKAIRGLLREDADL